MEIFAEYKRTDGLVSRLTLYADDERTQPIEIREKLARRADCLVERVTNVEARPNCVLVSAAPALNAIG